MCYLKMLQIYYLGKKKYIEYNVCNINKTSVEVRKWQMNQISQYA